jgi:hypothetical protein
MRGTDSCDSVHPGFARAVDPPHGRKSLRIRSGFVFSGRIGTAAWMAAALVLMSAATVKAEVLFNDSTVTVSVASDGGTSRTCTVRLKPVTTLGGGLAPRLILETRDPSLLSFGVENPGWYSNVVVVHNGTRVPVAGTDLADVDKFRKSSLAAALRSQGTFFITARRVGAPGYVSSRYERVDFDVILAKIESGCLFDAESLMTDLRPRLLAERALSIPKPDLTLIRWALLKRYDRKYESLAVEPDARSELSSAERDYLKRYAGTNGLTPSKYITAEIAALLLAEGRDVAAKAAETFFSLEVCNKTMQDAWVAISARKTPEDGTSLLQGWWPVSVGSCNKLGKFARGKFYVTAVAPPTRIFGLMMGGGDPLAWSGPDMPTLKCTEFPAAFERPDNPGPGCSGGKTIPFHELDAGAVLGGVSGNYTWSIGEAPPFSPPHG